MIARRRLIGLGALAIALGLEAESAASPAASAAASHPILVMPVDGTADLATRGKLTAQLVALAHRLDGQVTRADATFAETALAVGCNPHSPPCSEQVLATVAVDELIWGTATAEGSQIRVVVQRRVRGAPPRELAISFAAADAPDRIDARLAPLFGQRPAATEPAVPPPAPTPPGPSLAPLPSADASPTSASPTAAAELSAQAPQQPSPSGRRTAGIALVAGGGVAIAVGVALWISASSLQGQINNHPTRDLSDFDDLRSLESRAITTAVAGDILVPIGLAAGGLGAYCLLRRGARGVAVVPTATAHGVGLAVVIPGGL